MKCRNKTLPGLSRILFSYIPVLSDWVFVAAPTFKIRSNSGIVTRNFAHELVQELGGRHRGGSFPRRSLFWSCQAGRQKGKCGWREKMFAKLGSECNEKENFWQAERWMWDWTVVIIHQHSLYELLSFTSKVIHHLQQQPASVNSTREKKEPRVKGHSGLRRDWSYKLSSLDTETAPLCSFNASKQPPYTWNMVWNVHLNSTHHWPEATRLSN